MCIDASRRSVALGTPRSPFIKIFSRRGAADLAIWGGLCYILARDVGKTSMTINYLQGVCLMTAQLCTANFYYYGFTRGFVGYYGKADDSFAAEMDTLSLGRA